MHPFLAHLIGDFLIQNEWMAINKKKSSFACLVHAVTYLIPFLFSNLAWWQLILIGATHFAQDRSAFVLWWLENWKRIPEKHWGTTPMFVDQTFHILIIQIVIWLPEFI